MFKKVYATAIFKLKDNITVSDEHALVLDICEKNIIFTTTKKIKPTAIENVMIYILAGKSRCVFSCRLDAYKTVGGRFVYKAIFPKDKEATLPNGKVIKLTNQSFKKYKASSIQRKTKNGKETCDYAAI